jgi:hypothetical protein
MEYKLKEGNYEANEERKKSKVSQISSRLDRKHIKLDEEQKSFFDSGLGLMDDFKDEEEGGEDNGDLSNNEECDADDFEEIDDEDELALPVPKRTKQHFGGKNMMTPHQYGNQSKQTLSREEKIRNVSLNLFDQEKVNEMTKVSLYEYLNEVFFLFVKDFIKLGCDFKIPVQKIRKYREKIEEDDEEENSPNYDIQAIKFGKNYNNLNQRSAIFNNVSHKPAKKMTRGNLKEKILNKPKKHTVKYY